ncbi:hypothetical protein PR048_011462 [Dryococelus australis]|uniref:Transposase n=1 Tax=Dryococelus australis TaxID=614101 RepID=A0ABQ9HM57_9NEOP|nr:hypothetical protein PR048_011462 [Dryococelus australis]
MAHRAPQFPRWLFQWCHSFTQDTPLPQRHETLLERQTQKLKVTLFVSDRHCGIHKLMRTKYPSITHEFDVWHLSKSLAKKLKAIGKHSYLIQAWSQSIINNLWWSSKACDNNEEMLLEKFTSILHHITDVHKKDGNKFVNACEHDDLLTRKWLQPNCHDHRLLCSIINDKQLLHHVKHTKIIVTPYKPKRNHFSYDGMVAHTILSILNFNNNRGRSRKVAVNVYGNKTHKWRKEIFERAILVVKGKLWLELYNDPHCATRELLGKLNGEVEVLDVAVAWVGHMDRQMDNHMQHKDGDTDDEQLLLQHELLQQQKGGDELMNDEDDDAKLDGLVAQ